MNVSVFRRGAMTLGPRRHSSLLELFISPAFARLSVR